MMRLNGLHLLLTYQCPFECDHCFVWGSPWQSGVMTLQDIRYILQQARELGSVTQIYYEGGEPFLYYPILLKAIREAHRMGFGVGVVTNVYWATSREDAIEWLKPMVGLVNDFSISSDLYHYSEAISREVHYAAEAIQELAIPLGVISIAQPQDFQEAQAVGQLPPGVSAVMFRGRAAEKLVQHAVCQPWEHFTECPYEDLRDPGRVHIDPFGYLHICQGITIGNLFHESLIEICDRFDPFAHPITAALLTGGPAELVRRYELAHQDTYADACHLCYEARRALRDEFPQALAPDQMYGVPEGR